MLNVVMLSIFMLNVVLLSVFMLNVVMLSVIMLCVVCRVSWHMFTIIKCADKNIWSPFFAFQNLQLHVYE